MTQVTYQHWRHNKSGELYGVRLENGEPTHIDGPLHYMEAGDPSDYNYDYEFEGDPDDYDLVEKQIGDVTTVLLSENMPSQSGPGGHATTDGDEVTVFYDGKTYGYCTHGVHQGLYYEDYDVIGFDSPEEALKAARELYAQS